MDKAQLEQLFNRFYFEGFFLPDPYLWHFLLNIALHVLGIWNNVMVLMREYLVAQAYPSSNPLVPAWQDPLLWLGLILGVIFVIAAGWLRRRCYDRQ